MSTLAPIGRVHILTATGLREVDCYARAGGLVVTQSADAPGLFHITLEDSGHAVSSGTTESEWKGLPQEVAVALMYRLAELAPWLLMSHEARVALLRGEGGAAIRAARTAAYARAAAQEGGAA